MEEEEREAEGRKAGGLGVWGEGREAEKCDPLFFMPILEATKIFPSSPSLDGLIHGSQRRPHTSRPLAR